MELSNCSEGRVLCAALGVAPDHSPSDHIDMTAANVIYLTMVRALRTLSILAPADGFGGLVSGVVHQLSWEPKGNLCPLCPQPPSSGFGGPLAHLLGRVLLSFLLNPHKTCFIFKD